MAGDLHQDTVRSDDQQAAQRSLVHLRGGTQLLLAAGGALQGGKPDPGGEIPSALEDLSGWGKGRQGYCGHWAHAGNGHQPACCLILLGPLGDLMVQTRNLLVQSPECLNQHLEDWSGDLWDRLVWIFHCLHELRDASRPFGRHDAELGQMTAQGIDDLGSLLHQKIPGLKHESCGLGLLALGHHKAHGRALAASQIASASAASFFWRLTKGFT
jgi:hypothetical protein